MATLSVPGLERSPSMRSMKSLKPPGTIVRIKKKSGEMADMVVGEDGNLQPLANTRSNSISAFSPSPVISMANSANVSRPQTPLASPPLGARKYKGAPESPHSVQSHPMLRQLSAVSPTSPSVSMPQFLHPSAPSTPQGPKSYPAPTTRMEIVEKTPAEVGMSYRERFGRIYQKYAPEKIEKVEALLKHPAGCEAVMVELVKLYGPEPMVLVPTSVPIPPGATENNTSSRSQSPSHKTYKKVVKRAVSRSNLSIPLPAQDHGSDMTRSTSMVSPLLPPSAPLSPTKIPTTREAKPKPVATVSAPKAVLGANAKAVSDRIKNLRSSDSDSSDSDDSGASTKRPTVAAAPPSPAPVAPSIGASKQLGGSTTSDIDDSSPRGLPKSTLFAATQRPSFAVSHHSPVVVEEPTMLVTPPSDAGSRQGSEIVPDRSLQHIRTASESGSAASLRGPSPTVTANTVAPPALQFALNSTTLNTTQPPSIVGESSRRDSITSNSIPRVSDSSNTVSRTTTQRTALTSSPVTVKAQGPTFRSSTPSTPVATPQAPPRSAMSGSITSNDGKKGSSSQPPPEMDKRAPLRNATPPRGSRTEPTYTAPPSDPTPWPLRPYQSEPQQRPTSTSRYRDRSPNKAPSYSATPTRSSILRSHPSAERSRSPRSTSTGPRITFIDRSTYTPNIGKPQPINELFGRKQSEIKCPVRIGPPPTPKRHVHKGDAEEENDERDDEEGRDGSNTPPRPGQQSPGRRNSPSAARTLAAFESLKHMSYKNMKGDEIKELAKTFHQTPKNSKYTYFDGLSADTFSCFTPGKGGRPSPWAMAPTGNGNGALLAKIQKNLYKVKEEVERSPPRAADDDSHGYGHHTDPHNYNAMTVADLLAHSKRIIRTTRGHDNAAENADELDVLGEGGGGKKRTVGLDSKAGVDEIIFEKHLPHAYGQQELMAKRAQTIVRADQGVVCVIREVPKDPEVVRQQKALSDRLSKPRHLFVARDVVIPTNY